ncbi:hypothetical protein AIOL_002623 [Candidatus Rhodobacter oscarellae]|uniref:Sodium-dependent transporter n=2 Tax=Candidatus Rhodobacter oscarellae TaxID=1675527 RepID=A0A0J9GVR8_9RHOB|nr:hypothetical protein AIOL_002623 [Candidatus Rhodobacter lobularis]
MLLVLGLLGGFALPAVAEAMRPWLPYMVAFLVFVSALRIGAQEALGKLSDARANLGRVLALQLGLPLGVIATLWALGALSSPFAVGALLALAAPSISGSPAFTALMGHDPAPAMRLLILGTALLPLTVIPLFALMPAFGGLTAVIWAALKLTAVILLAASAAFWLRARAFPRPGAETTQALDGLAALTLAVIVIGLMSAVGPALRSDPAALLPWLALVFALNFGMQLLARALGADVATSVVAGNRNVALFLVALPAEIITPLLLFIGCYQIPMYLTPLVMKPLYART